ncbi:MAG: SixA phosphatase family protein [Bacteroidota bacterium]
MKRIVIVRHAKAVPYGYDDDFNRDLTDRGVKDAGRISLQLVEQAIIPDMMISSPATRALHTAIIFAGSLGFAEESVQRVRELYMEYTTAEFLEFIQGLPEEASTVFIFGHNPGVSYYADRLSRNFRGDMPTCSTVVIDFDVQAWTDVESRLGRVAYHFYPKMFRGK